MMNSVFENSNRKWVMYLLIFVYWFAVFNCLLSGSYVWAFLWFASFLATMPKVQHWFLTQYQDFLKPKHFDFFRLFILICAILTVVFAGTSSKHEAFVKIQQEYSLKKEVILANLQNSSWEIKEDAVQEGAKYRELADFEFLKAYDNAIAELALHEKQIKLKNFNDQKDQIRSKVQSLIKENKLQEAQSYMQPYKDIAGNSFNDLEKLIADELKKVAENKRLQERLNDPKKLEYMAVIDSYLYEMKNAKISDIKQSPDIDITLFKIKSYGNIYHEASLYEFTPAENKILQDYKVQVIAFQKKAFPRMREIYGRFVDQRGWEFDIDGKSFGDGFRKIEFIGYPFSLNANIQSLMNSVNPLLTDLRFKQARFRWDKIADEYTYYNIDSLSDGEIKN